MTEIFVEFINTCPTCANNEALIKQVAAKYGDKVKVKIYKAGEDYDYVQKYGMVSKGTMIINEAKKYDNLSPRVIEEAISNAVKKGKK
jgi:S-adenosylmethionine hydrolase